MLIPTTFNTTSSLSEITLNKIGFDKSSLDVIATQDGELMDYEWDVTNVFNYTLLIQMEFEDPLKVSALYEFDNLEVKFKI